MAEISPFTLITQISNSRWPLRNKEQIQPLVPPDPENSRRHGLLQQPFKESGKVHAEVRDVIYLSSDTRARSWCNCLHLLLLKMIS